MPDTVTCRVVVAGAPSSSVTRRPTVNVPVLVKVRVAVVPVPSSKLPSLSVSQARAAMAPSPSVEASVKVTCWPVWGDDGATVKEAVGAWFGGGVPASAVRPKASTNIAVPETAPPWLTRTPRLPPEVVVVRVTRSCFQEVVSVVLGELTSATTVPPAARSRSLSWTVLPTDAVVAAFTETVAV